MFINILILFLPLFNFLSISFFGRFLGFNGSSFLSAISSISIFFISIKMFFLFNGTIIKINFGSWFSAGLLNVNWCFVFDSLSITMLVLVSTVSMVVQLYSLEYMSEDPEQTKFLSYIALFTFCMIVLITADNLMLLLVGWEGVGLCSFLLISFWNKRLTACKAAIKAIVFNRFGDIGFFVGLCLIVFYTQSVSFSVIANTLPYYHTSSVLISELFYVRVIDFILFFLSLGVFGKSAQIGLHVWLLDAMEGPTPVSALIHAATMVTAGIFLLIRLSFILEFGFFIKYFIAAVGIFTAFNASLIGTVQNDIKSIVAYSTCSQLGYMVAACGVSGYVPAFFHLINHGFFKALLFLCSGVIIHNFLEEQDIRKMGGLSLLFPLTSLFFLVGSMSLMGIPFLSGFYSKDLILEFFYVLPFNWCNLLFQLGYLSVVFTTFYSARLFYYTFLDNPNAYKKSYSNTKESYTSLMISGMSLLFFGSVFSGFIFFDVFAGYGTLFFNDSVYFSNLLTKKIIFIEFFFLQSKSLWFSFKSSTFFLILLTVCGFMVMKKSVNITKVNKIYFYVYSFVYNGLLFNYVFINSVCSKFFKICVNFFFLEKGIIECCVNNIVQFLYRLSFFVNKAQQLKENTDLFFIITYLSIFFAGISVWF